MAMANPLMQEAFSLLEAAKELEVQAEGCEDDSPSPAVAQRGKDGEPSWVLLNRSADKYYEACHLMTNVVRNGARSGAHGVGAADDKTKRLLAENIRRYEPHADGLRSKAALLKDAHDSQVNGDAEKAGGAENGDGREHGNQRSGQSSGEIMRRRDAAESEAEGKASRLLAAAKNHEEMGERPASSPEEAVRHYIQAAQSYLHAIELLSREKKEGADSLILALRRKMKATLDRIEALKDGAALSPSPPASTETAASIRSDRLTPYEIKVLSWSSRIASGVFLPWSEEEARNFNYSPAQLYVDPDGLLRTSDKQKEKLCKWARPREIADMRSRRSSSSPPCRIAMVKSITPYTIKQNCVSDCSFIAGLCIAAAFERRFRRQLVSSLIYPQDEAGQPVYNPKGVYLVKLWLNGVARRVIVDDFLPVDERGYLLCSHTTVVASGKEKSDGNFGILELWVPILEKAYMKLAGGYDFPGSNSGVDLFSLTGWIPERILFPKDPGHVQDFETPPERAWERLSSASTFGDCLVTVSTSKELTEEQAERVGLFTGHAYAVLGVIKTSDGTRILQLKNPWASKGWKGRFSPQDNESWKDPAFCAEVGYAASLHDDGVFWISWEDILLYFRNIHLSWNTDRVLFPCSTRVHGFWSKDRGPNDDSYNIGDNPQYTITFSDKAIKSGAKLWLLLSRHVTKQEQAGGNVTDFLTLHIHRIKNQFERVWYPSNCILSGAYTNDQHVLVLHQAGPEDKFLSIVLSQYEKSNDLGYTLSCFCTEHFELGQPENVLPISRQLSGSWKLRDSSTENSYSLPIGSAGGPPGKGSFGSNPQWSIRVSCAMTIQIKCMAPKEIPINIILARGIPGNSGSQRIHHLYEDPILDTGAYRHGFTVSEPTHVPMGFYTLVVSTFVPGQVGKFLVHVFSSKEVSISEID